MDDQDLLGQIEQLVEEEHQLFQRAATLTEADHDRLRELEVRLDQYWDLLRQRRARRGAGLDPDAATPRPPVVVETYEQ